MCSTEDELYYWAEQVTKNLCCRSDIPQKYIENNLIIQAERKAGNRLVKRRGYDILSNNFFVEECLLSNYYDKYGQNVREGKPFVTKFKSFGKYYEYLSGDIYNNSCYYQYHFSKKIVTDFNINLGKINAVSFCKETIDSVTPNFSSEELSEYDAKEKSKENNVSQIVNIRRCNSYNELNSLLSKSSKINENNLLSLYCFSDNPNVFTVMKDYVMSRNACDNGTAIAMMCYIFGKQIVFDALPRRVFPVNLLRHEFTFSIKKRYFDKNTHFYICEIWNYYINKPDMHGRVFKVYFETFQQFAEFLNNNLSSCDISAAYLPDVDFSQYIINSDTILPISAYKELNLSLKKEYNAYSKKFEVTLSWRTPFNKVIKTRSFDFEYFCDFIYFLKNDLSNANLLYCEDLVRTTNCSNIDFSNAMLSKKVIDKLGLSIKPIFNLESLPISLEKTKQTEMLYATKEIALAENMFDESDSKQIFYITDLHLLHKLKNNKHNDEVNAIKKLSNIVNDIVESYIKNRHHFAPPHLKDILLIGGDISSDFNLFSMFIKMLRHAFEESCYSQETIPYIIFTLGNHELWAFPQALLSEIIQNYQSIIKENGMYLLYNSILYEDDSNNLCEISQQNILSASQGQLRTKLQKARTIVFGGIGFSGKNEEFNANDGVYKNALDRSQEIAESQLFDSLYTKVCKELHDRSVIVFSHMPCADWNNDGYKNNFIYVSGHNHHNYFYDDGEIRIYQNNQVGYKGKKAHLKYFYIDDKYDSFADFQDGIHEISREQYIEFYIGKRISIQFKREFNKLYMLKKSGYYCFIFSNKSNNLFMLCGGQEKKLRGSDLSYYYNNMEFMISKINRPLSKYTELQNEIAAWVKSFNGYGTVHGAIVDIDYNCHIYVNPYDSKITPYFALDMIDKTVYPNIGALLQDNCPLLYDKYRLVEQHSKHLPAKYSSLIESPIHYTDTDIYKASRQIKKMQRLHNNILTVWYYDDNSPTLAQLPQIRKS